MINFIFEIFLENIEFFGFYSLYNLFAKSKEIKNEISLSTYY